MSHFSEKSDIKLRQHLHQIAEKYGLHVLGRVRLGPDPLNFSRFESWLAEGKHAGMEFLTRNRELRQDPRGLLEGAKTAFILALPYALGDHKVRGHSRSRIAQYARYRDYHKTLKRKARLLWDDFSATIDYPLSFRVLVDSAPILERSLAARTERGFIGKNTCYIHPDYGSFLLLASILTDLDLPADVPAPINPNKRQKEGGCGTCRRCQVYCPTGALSQDYQLDANLCLAYWTIEHRGAIPLKFWHAIEKYWFGCDICQNVCPYNRKIEIPSDRRREARLDMEQIDLFEVATMDQEFYESKFGGTPLTRAKRIGLRRNALIALVVKKDERLDQLLNLLKADTDVVISETVQQAYEWLNQN